MKWLFGLGLLLASLPSFGQLVQRADSVVYPGGFSLALVLAAPDDTNAVVQLAEHDIAAGHLFVLLQGGISPVVYPSDQAFSREFGLAYWDNGCTGPAYLVMKAYNGRVFDCLKTKYGRSWLRGIRKDAIGLKEWKRKQHS